MAIDLDTDEDVPEPDEQAQREIAECSAAESNAPPQMIREQREWDRRVEAGQ